MTVRPRDNTEKIRVLLVETSAKGQMSSMKRYGELLERALAEGVPGSLEVRRINLAPPEVVMRLLPTRLRGPAHHAWIILIGPLLLSRERADLVHLLDGSHGYLGRCLARMPSVATVHDLIPLLRAKGLLGDSRPGRLGRLLAGYSLKGLARMDWIVADSESTRFDLQRFTNLEPSTVCVVHPALAPDISGQGGISWGSSLPTEADDQRKYILHLGHSGFYKNRLGVLEIFAHVRKECKVGLVLAGPAPGPEMLRRVRELGLERDVEFVIDPKDEVLQHIYRRASLFLFPSLYEGFGWPPLEAMSLGCPVVCSSAGSLPEVVGNAALCCPLDEETLARSCISVLENEDLARRLTRRGRERIRHFTVKRMGDELLAVYRQVLARNGHPGYTSFADHSSSANGRLRRESLATEGKPEHVSAREIPIGSPPHSIRPQRSHRDSEHYYQEF